MALINFTSYRWYYELFLYMLNCLKVVVVFIYIKFNTHLQYVLNPNMDITTAQKILLFSLILYAIVLFFGAKYAITCFIDLFFCSSNICSDYF